MKKINPVIASVVNQRNHIVSNIKLAKLAIEKDEQSLAEIDSYFSTDPGYKRFTEISGLEGRELLKACIDFFSEIFDKIADTPHPDIDRVQNTSNFINHLRHIEVDYSEKLAAQQNVWGACINHLGYLNHAILETIEDDEWVYRGLCEAVSFAQHSKAIKEQMEQNSVLTPATRQTLSNGYHSGRPAISSMMSGGPMYGSNGYNRNGNGNNGF